MPDALAVPSPRYEVGPGGAAWLAHLDAEGVTNFYHNPRLYAWLRAHGRLGAILKPLVDALAPRGYSRQDSVGGPSAGDLVVSRLELHLLARRAWLAIHAGSLPTKQEMDALLLILHEHTHCMVRLDAQGNALPDDLDRYSHPDALLAGYQHAKRLDYPINAFTGLLRKHRLPAEAWERGLDWFGDVLRSRGEVA